MHGRFVLHDDEGPSVDPGPAAAAQRPAGTLEVDSGVQSAGPAASGKGLKGLLKRKKRAAHRFQADVFVEKDKVGLPVPVVD